MGQGSQAKLLLESDATFDANSFPLAFVSESLKQNVELNIDDAIRGTRSRSKERSHISLKRVGGNITCKPSPAELDYLLPLIMGAAESSDTFAVAETLPEFWVYIQRTVEEFMYTACKVSTATFSSSEGQPLQLSLDIVGKTRTKAGTFPTVALDTDAYYTHSQAVLTIGGSTYAFNNVEVKIDNVAEVLFENSQTASTIEATDRIVTWTVDTPFDSDGNTLQDAIDNGEQVAGSLVYTNGNQSLTFTSAALMATDADPSVGGRGKIRYPITFQALQSGTTKELVITHDADAAT